MTNLITRITTWLNTAWLFVKRNWAIIVPPTVVVVTLGLAAVAATTTLTRCGCQGPVPTVTPYPTVPPTVTAMPSLTPTAPTTPGTPTPTPLGLPTPTSTPPPTPTPVITPTQALTCSFALMYEHTDGSPAFYTVDVTDTVSRPEPVYRLDARWRVEEDGAMVSQGTIPNALEPITASMTVEFTPTGQLNGDLVFTPTVPYSGMFDVYVYGCWVDYAMSYPTVCVEDGADHWSYYGRIER